jgi:drug/metabolite transporter (DMT)-like permease
VPDRSRRPPVSRSVAVLFLVVAALWGFPYALISVALEHGAGPLLIAWARVTIGAALLVIVTASSGQLRGLRGHTGSLIAVAMCDIAVPFVALSVGEQHLSSSLASILIATTPLFVGILAVAFLPAERPSGKTWAGLGIGFAGVVALFGTGLGGSPASAGLILVAAASYAGASLLVRARLGRVGSLPVSACALGIAAVALAPGAFLEPPGHADATAWVAISVLGVLCTAAAFALYYELIARAGATRAALTTYFSPLLSVAVGTVVLAESLAASAVLGFALILAGSWLTR